jgi:hypothetical protein
MGDKKKIPFLNSLPPRRRKLLYWVVGLLLFYTVTGFLILPLVIRSVAVKQLSKQLDREVSIQKVQLNPYAFSTAIRGLLIKDKDGEPLISWDEVYVNFQLSSFLGHPWVVKEIRIVSPFARAQMNKDGTFNFSDLITKFASTNAPAAPPPKTPAKPAALWIGRLLITNATASVTDLTHRNPFKRLVGPLTFALDHFETNPDSRNPHTFTGTTDAGEKIYWNGFFFLDPLRSWGELTLDNFSLTKYAPLYEERLPFEIRDGVIGLHVQYHLDLSVSNRVMAVTNTAFALRNFKLAGPGAEKNFLELDHFAITDASADIPARQTEIGSVLADNARLYLLRTTNNVAAAVTNPAAPAQFAETTTNSSCGLPALLGSITNAIAQFLRTTNYWTGTIHDLEFTNVAFHLEDLTPSRPARLDLDDITLSVKNISNDPKTNLTTALALRWNTNGAIKTDVSVSFVPLTADVQFALDRIDFGTLDPYLESKLNLFIPGSEFGLHSQIQLRTPEGQLPDITLRGDTWIDGLRVVDGVIGEDLLKWNSFRISGIDVKLNPLAVAIKEITLDNVAAHLIIETNHTVNLVAALTPVGATNAPAETNAPATTNATMATVTESTRSTLKTAEPAAVPPISIGAIVITNNSASFTDRSLTPNVNMAILDFSGTIAGITSTESGRADINLRAKVDGVGPLDISGHINPFSKTETKDLTVTLKNMDLTPAGPYSGKFAGYRIAKGKLNLDLAYNIVGRNLKSKNVISLDRFTFGDKSESPDATKLPVRLAIALLKDRNGQILLDVPVEGSLDDPKFRVGKVVWHTVLNILTKAATSPFSLLGALVGGGGEELSYQDFAPGSAVLSPDSQKKLDSLAKALYERPGLQLEISGSIDPDADRDGLRRIALDKQIRNRIWTSLGKAERAATTPDQLPLTPEDRSAWVKKLYNEAWDKGVLNSAFIAANTNLAAAVAQLKPVSTGPIKGATWLMQGSSGTAKSKPSTTAKTATTAKPAMSNDPMEILLLATFPVSNADFQALVDARAKAVQTYLLATGKVEAERLFLAENKTGGVKSDGSRVYLQFQ